MSTDVAEEDPAVAEDERGGLRQAVPVTGFVLKVLAIAVGFFFVGLVAPRVMGDNEFTGVVVGMTWSLAGLIVLVTLVGVVGATVREVVR